MSRTVDDRIVSMQFDNKQFESNVQTSLNTLDKLKQSLKLDGATKGLENIDYAAKRTDMSPLGSAVDSVRTKFSALEVMSITALANITNSAVNAGKRIVSALTIDPIKSGFSEYETKINAIQTILSNTSSKGTTMDDVTRVIGELNTYADKTIYNFAEMTRNIGTFTAAGVGLEESASAIQGIANLAAASGSTSQQASTAMYQLSQALSSGTVKLMDWNSVINAGMGGQKFQDALKATAREQGIVVDAIINKYGSFRESLQAGWITADVLNETLNKFTVDGAKKYAKSMMESGKWTQEQADALIKEAQAMEDAATKVKTFTQLWDTLKESAQSGWSQTWEIIVGDFEEAKETLTKFSDVIGGMINSASEARNNLLQGWKDKGGRADLIESLYNIFEGIMSIIKPIKEAFREIFPPTTVEQLVGLTRGFKELTEKFKLSDTTANNLKRTFKGVFALFSIAVQAIKAVVGGFAKLIGYISPAGDGLLGFTAGIGDFIVSLNNATKASEVFTKIVRYILNVVKPVTDGLMSLGAALADVFSELGSKTIERFKTFTSLGNLIKAIFVGIGRVIEKIAPFIISAAKGIGNVLSGILDTVSSSIQNADYSGIFDIVNGSLMTVIGAFIAKFIKAGSDILDSAGGFFDNINGILGEVADALSAFTNSLKADALKKIAIAIAILAAALLVLSLIDSEKLGSSIAAVTMLFGELFGALSLFGKLVDGKEFKKMVKTTTAMISMSAAVLILAFAMKVVSTLSWNEIAKGLVATGAGLGALVLAVNLLPEQKVTKAAKAIKKLSTALLIFAVAMKIMGSMSWSELAIGLTATVVGLAALVAALHLLPKNVGLKAAGVILLSTALIVLGGALKIMATMEWDEIARSLVVLSGSLLVLSAAMALMKRAIPGAAAMLIVAPALVVLAGALKIMATMSWDEACRSVIALAASMAVLSASLLLMKHAVPGALAMLVVAPALVLFASVLKLLATMSFSDIATGLIIIASGFTILGVAGLVLKPIIGTIVALSGAMLLFGAACLMAGVGVAAIAVALTTLSAGASAIAIGIVTIVSSIISLIPYLIEQIGVGIIKFCDVIAGGVDAICSAIAAILVAIADAIVAAVPPIVEALFVVVTSLLVSLAKYTPDIVDALFDFLIALLDGIARRLPDLIKAGVNLLMSFLSGVVDALKSIDPNILVEGLLAVGFLSALMVSLAAMAVLAPAAMVGVLGMAAVITELAIVIAALGALSQLPGLEWLVTEGGNFLQKIGTAIGQFVGGIVGGLASGISASLPQIGTDLSKFMKNVQPFIEGAKLIDTSVFESVKSLVSVIVALTAANLLEGITSWLTGGSSLADFGQEIAEFGPHLKAFADSVSGINPESVTAAANAAKALADMTTHIPNEGGMVSWFTGENSIAKFGNDIIVLGKGLKGFSDSVVGINPEAVTAAANAATALADMTTHIPNEGGMVSWFTGENSIAKFGDDIVVLGKGLKGFSDAVVGVNAENVTAAAKAAQALAEMTTFIPNEGGVASWFAGENSIAKFGDDIIVLGEGLRGFSDIVEGIVPENVSAATKAAKALAEMSDTIPNEGGMVSWFTGDNSLSKFGSDIVLLGIGLKGFSDAVHGIDTQNVHAATTAAKALADMADTIPNQGGVVSWFTGDNSVSSFASELPTLGSGLKKFSDATVGIIPENIIAASKAAATIADMTTHIPNEGGVTSWFTGEKSISKFGNDIVALGKGLKGFATSTVGIVPANVIAAAEAAKALAEMSKSVPTTGGVAAWFAGEQSLSKFGNELTGLGKGLKGFSDHTTGIVPENVKAAASAAKALADMSTAVPTTGGVVGWFAGEQSLSKFGNDIVALGKGLKGFADVTTGITPDTVIAAANAAKALADLTTIIPKEDGIVGWFSGESGLAKFAGNLPALGTGLKGFSDATNGIVAETVTAAATSLKALAELTKIVPDVGGIQSWFSGESGLAAFADQLPGLGDGIKKFSDAVNGVVPENVTAAASAAKALAEITKCVPDDNAWETVRTLCSIATMFPVLGTGLKGFSDSLNGINVTNIEVGATAADKLGRMASTIPADASHVKTYGETLKAFGPNLASFVNSTRSITLDDVTKILKLVSELKHGITNSDTFNTNATTFSKGLTAVKDAMLKISQFSSTSADGFIGSIRKVTNMNLDEFAKNFTNAAKSLEKAGADMVENLITGIKSKKPDVAEQGESVVKQFNDGMKRQKTEARLACLDVLDTCVSAITSKFEAFKTAGKDLVSGFANGISINTYKAEAKARAMAAAAAEAAKEELDEHSPSKVGYEIGDFFGVAFVNAIGDNVSDAYSTGSELAASAKNGLKDAIAKVRDVINSDIDTQPTIRPILDLSDIKSGASAIGSMLSGRTLAVNTNTIGAVSASMDGYHAGGGFEEVVSAINALRKDYANTPHTVNHINGITYDDGSNVADAIQVLVRAARVEGRSR